jgi:hypothetical protein
MMRLLYIIILTTCLTTGCTTSLSRYEPYRTYVGKTSPLRVEMRLAKSSSPRLFAPSFSLIPPEWDWPNVATLPPGTLVTITSVIRFYGFDENTIEAIGTVTTPQTAKTYRFSFLWSDGLGRDDLLTRAPWESTTVPEKRFVGFSGKEYRSKP